MPGKGRREPVMAEAEDGKNGQQGQEGQGGQPEPIDYKAKYEAMSLITSQNVTAPKPWDGMEPTPARFDYQSECHCSKTPWLIISFATCLITSQNVTAPKRHLVSTQFNVSLITSQNVTAPKLLPYDEDAYLV